MAWSAFRVPPSPFPKADQMKKEKQEAEVVPGAVMVESYEYLQSVVVAHEAQPE